MLKKWSKMAAVLVLFLTLGCAGNRPYRTTSWETTKTNTPIAIPAIETTNEFTLGFIEFDDQGALWNPAQQKAVVDHIAETAKEEGVLLAIFVHGWKHNASIDDSNVELFRGALRELYQSEKNLSAAENRQPLRVVGVYLGWRGLTLEWPVIKNLSFWNRKDAAHRVGFGAVAETFIRLENEMIRANRLGTPEGAALRRSRSTMISMGHSFGGAVLYSALSGILTDRIISREEGITSGAGGLGDLVILINPAFEATRIAPLIDGTQKRPETLEGERRPVLAVFTSKGDWATKVAFPIGRVLSTQNESYRSKSQKKADRTAVGHYRPMWTHTLRAKPHPRPKPKSKTQEAHSVAAAEAAVVESDQNKVQAVREEVMSQTRLHEFKKVDFSNVILEPVGQSNEMTPVLVVSVENSVIDGHHDVAKPVFLKFLGEFIVGFSNLPRN